MVNALNYTKFGKNIDYINYFRDIAAIQSGLRDQAANFLRLSSREREVKQEFSLRD